MHIEIRTVFARCVVLMIRVSQLVSGTAVEQEEQSLLRRCKQNYVRTWLVVCILLCLYSALSSLLGEPSWLGEELA